MTKEIKIQIIGKPGHGKTALARAINQFLSDNGFLACVVDKDKSHHPTIQLEAMKSLSQCCAVTIETVQTHRVCFEDDGTVK